MSDRKLVVNIEGSDHEESNGEDVEVLRAEMTSIRSDLSSTALSRDDGVEITAAPLTGTSTQSAARINVYDNIPFAGGDGDYSVLSVLFGAHSIGEGIFGFLNMKDSNKVCVQCVECCKAVKDFPWMDTMTRIRCSVKAWGAAFPCARAVNVLWRQDMVDSDFVHIRGDARVRLHTVIISRCSRVTDAAFVHLRGIHTLNMKFCSRFTDASFVRHELLQSGNDN